MKEILFRGKCPIIDEQNDCTRDTWVFGNLLCKEVLIDRESRATAKYYTIKEGRSDVNFYPEYPVKDFTVGQYTGMNDIHGNKIFEGDIVNSSFFVQGIVVYLEAVGAYIISTEPPEFITVDNNWDDCDWIFICDCGDLEVVGNIVDGVFIKEEQDNAKDD